MDTLPVWKRIYPIIASSNTHVTANVVNDVLTVCKEHITNVFLNFKCYSRDSFFTWKQQFKEIVSDDEMCNFIHNLSRQLDLDANVAWTVICNFLMYEYYGKVDELKTLIKYDSKIEYLTENIWHFYTADRMFLLKTLRHILEGIGNKSHIYYKKIDSFSKTLNLTVLWQNLVKVLNNLIYEIDKDKITMVPTDMLLKWIRRNNREQIEVILLLMHTINLLDLQLTGLELENILVLCMRHGFSRLPLYTDSVTLSREEDLQEIKNAEIALVLTIIHKYWKATAVMKTVTLPPNMEKNIELLQMQGDTSIILFAWLIFKANNEDSRTKDNNLEYCSAVVEKMIEKNLFLSVYELLTHQMFSNAKSGDILVDAVYTLMGEFSKLCGDFTYLHEHSEVCKITAELLKRKGLIVLENLGPIFQLSMEAFPFVFEPFLEMCKSLLVIPDRYDMVLNLLNKIPGFLAEIPWNDHRQRFTLIAPQKLFADSNLFTVPSGTVMERFVYQGNEYARFVNPFSFFLLMEQFIKSLSTISFEIGTDLYCYNNLTKLVLIGFKFLNHLLKHYKGDYKQNHDLRLLIQRLEVVPAQFCEEPATNFDFIKLYFEVNCTLVTNELLDYMEAFPTVQRKRFLPTVVMYSKENRNALFGQLHNKCFLFKSLKEEEGRYSHTLLIQYLELIYFMIKKNLYHYEVQLPGIWYVINCTFPLFQQWSYHDSKEKTRISKICYSMLVEILQRHLSKVSDDSIIIFEFVIDSFFHEDFVMSSYISMLTKDKFYLQNLMEQESNWTNGPKLEEIECLRLQLVLLLLLLKHKTSIVSKRNSLVDNIGFFAKGVTPYIINPYSLSLRKLSCRFLKILSRDQNIPLMALLGLDYDQVQRLYLDRLRDSTEDDDLKVHILDLIGTCVVYQHGMTAAFFNVKRSRKWYNDNNEKTIEIDTVSDFMVDYLQNIKKSPKFLRSPLQIGILHVMANLWTSQKNHLIDDVMALKEFWPLLSNPLYREFDQLPRVYAYIFRIYGIQLIQKENDPKFLLAIQKFVTDTKQVKLFIDYLSVTFKSESASIEDIENAQFLLKSWMEFMIMLEKDQDLKKINESNKFQFISMVLDGIQLPLVNVHFMKLWVDLLLLQLSYWKIPKINQEKMLWITRKTINTINIIELKYSDLQQSTRLAILTVIQRILDILHSHFTSYSSDLLELLEPFGPMLEYEYLLIQEIQWNTVDDFDTLIRDQLLPWRMCVKIITGLFEYKNITDIDIWFSYRHVVQKLMDSTCEMVKNPRTLPFAKMLLHSLALYASSPMYFDFLNVDMNLFFMNIEPAITRLLYGQNNKINPLQLEEGWITCSLLIKFHTAYVQSLQQLTLTSCYNFITIYEQILVHIFNILETTVALKALDVVQNTLILFDSILLKWRIEWYRKSNSTYNFVLNGVKKVINACLYVILRPKNIMLYVLDESNRFNQLEKIPVDLTVAVMNRLVTVAGLGFSIIYKYNPDLINLLDVPLSDTEEVIIENDFSVPKFELPISNKLTYGMLLCLAHILCKMLDALYLGKNPTSSVSIGQSEEYFSRYFGMVEHQDFSDNLPTQKLSAFLLRYALNEYSGLAEPWIQKLDLNLIRFSLESLMTFLAQQTFLAVKTIEPENGSCFKRNLNSELQFFYEHVKKMSATLISFTPNEQLSQLTRNETDVLKRYLCFCKEVKAGAGSQVVDNNLCVIISYWFINLCKLR